MQKTGSWKLRDGELKVEGDMMGCGRGSYQKIQGRKQTNRERGQASHFSGGTEDGGEESGPLGRYN